MSSALKICGRVSVVGSTFVPAAAVYARLADADKAMDALLSDYQHRRFFVTFIKVDPAYDSLRSDARFVSLVQRMGL
jgi:hypothetical protein